MKVTVLGAGSAYGTPMMFNSWGKADPSNTKNERTRASLLLEENGKSILIDAGPDFRQQVNRANVQNIDAVFITHGHYDHIMGIPELPRATKILGHGIEVYASFETMSELKTCFSYLFKEKADAEPNSKSLVWKELPEKGDFTAAGLQFETLLFPHHRIHSSAFRYKNFAYVTDWQAIPEGGEEFLSGLELLLIECNNGADPEENGHSDIFKIKNLLNRIRPNRTVLTHLSTRIDFEAFSKELPPNCVLAYDGMELQF